MADQNGTLLLNFFDVYGDRVKDHADIMLTHQVLSIVAWCETSIPLSGSRFLTSIPFPRGRIVWRLIPSAICPSAVCERRIRRWDWHRPHVCRGSGQGQLPSSSGLHRASRGSAIALCRRATASWIPEQGWRRTLRSSGRQFAKAEFLNIVANVPTPHGCRVRTSWNTSKSLNESRGDRFFAQVTQQLREPRRTRWPAAASLRCPSCCTILPPGFNRPKSFKTDDH